MLSCSWNDINDDNIEEVCEMITVNITTVYLRWNSIGDYGIGRLCSFLPKLTSLFLDGNQITDIGVMMICDVIANGSELHTLSLHRNLITDTGASIVSDVLAIRLCPLTNLDLSGNRISNTGARSLVTCLKRNTLLLSLDISENAIDDDICLKAMRMTGLIRETREWCIGSSGVTDEHSLVTRLCEFEQTELLALGISNLSRQKDTVKVISLLNIIHSFV
eukprot:c2024_g1_i1.p1 GENE.c2024_g1_i1~~c2024_g1_i1.p1  ORF type:complete len:220 (+),score=41.08 c2024_g1_i1:38-697(+)